MTDHGCTSLSFPALLVSWSSFVWSNSATPATTTQTVKDPTDADQQSPVSNTSPCSAAATTGVGGDVGAVSGGARVASTVPELDKVDEFSAWAGINSAELGQVWACVA